MLLRRQSRRPAPPVEPHAEDRLRRGLAAAAARLLGDEHGVGTVQGAGDSRLTAAVPAQYEEARGLKRAVALHPHLVHLVARELRHPLNAQDAGGPLALEDAGRRRRPGGGLGGQCGFALTGVADEVTGDRADHEHRRGGHRGRGPQQRPAEPCPAPRAGAARGLPHRPRGLLADRPHERIAQARRRLELRDGHGQELDRGLEPPGLAPAVLARLEVVAQPHRLVLLQRAERIRGQVVAQLVVARGLSGAVGHK
jgi:hypothetical protein